MSLLEDRGLDKVSWRAIMGYGTEISYEYQENQNNQHN